MSDNVAFLLFGDESLDLHDALTRICRSPKPAVLTQSFLDEAGSALKKEVDQLSYLERQQVPNFSSIDDLNKTYQNSRIKNSALDSALLCIAQTAQYMNCVENIHVSSTASDELGLVGLSSGLFAATAIAIAPSLSALVPIAVQLTLFAFRTGLHVASLAQLLHQVPGPTESWTYILKGVNDVTVKSIIEKFNKENAVPTASQVFVSAITSKSTSISGPPSILKLLLNSNVFETKPKPLSVHGPYHAPHLHSNLNVEKILHLDDVRVKRALKNSKPRHYLMSPVTGTWYKEEESAQLIQAVVRDVLTQPVQLSKVFEGCILRAQRIQSPTIHVIPIGSKDAAADLAEALKVRAGTKVILLPDIATIQDASDIPTDHKGFSKRCNLAIVGMAGRFPDAASHEKLWELLEKGLDVHREVPKDRYDARTHTDPSGKAKNTSHTPYGCWIENPGLFDPRFFNMSPREAYQTCPMQRLSLSTAYEALEMSGYVPNRTRTTKLDRIGTFYGQTSDDWREINAAQDIDTYFITGGVRAFGPGRINYHFGFSGPSFSVDTACSSSAAALQLACTSLWAGDCDTAVVGGVSCMTNSDIFAGLSRGQFLSKKGPCATFDNEADGYCRADAVGTVIIKRLDDALAEKDNVLAVILETATNHSADAISITHPHGPTQETLYRSILDKAGVDPLDIDYVEMHGTGTQAGDGTEMRSVTNVFAPADRKRGPDQPLFLGAIKANVGHGEAASGVTALIKCLMMLEKNSIPPHVGIKKEINKGFPKDLAERNVHIAFHSTPLRKRSGAPRRIYVSNFSAAGGNTGLLLEDAPVQKPTLVDPRSTHVVAITAKSKSAMLRNAERLLDYLQKHPETSISDLAYTTTARRIQHNWRISVTASDTSSVQSAIRTRLLENVVPVLPEPPKVAFLFTGQGSHYAAMGKELFTSSEFFRETLLEYERVAILHGFPSFIPLIDGSVEDVQSLSPVVVQVGLVCFEMAMTKLWASWGIKPCVVLGHSLGEYAALNASGILSASDTIYLVGMRALALVEKCTPGTHVMVAVQGSVDSITSALEGKSTMPNVACINSNRETVLSGELSELSPVMETLRTSGFKCTQLNVPYAFHSAQVDPILDDFERLAESIHFSKEVIPIISSVLGRPLGEYEMINGEYLRNHARKTVNFVGGLNAAKSAGIVDDKTVWLEIGPNPICANMVKATLDTATITAPSLRKMESPYKTISSSLSVLHTAGANIDWNEFHWGFKDSVKLLDLPTYSFDDKNYWIQYEGDWCLTKGRAAIENSKPLVEEAKPKLSTTSVQKVTSEVIKGDIVEITIESDLAAPGLREVVTGHVVNGAFMCPSSLYGDMAMTVCDYAYKLVRPDATNIALDVSNMKVPKSLIARNDGNPQILKLTARVDANSRRADLLFFTESNKERVEHATCEVFFGDAKERLSEWQRSAYLIQSRLDWLKDAERTGKAHKIGRGLAYKLFAALVEYDQKYRGMNEVILSSENFEATSEVIFQTTEKDGKFMCSPYWIDSLAHISGFIVNGSDATDSREKVYISHGWQSFNVGEPISADKTYRSYVKMQPTEPNVMAGDVYVFDGTKIVAVVMGLKFQGIPRKVFNMILPPTGSANTARSAPVAKKVEIPKPASKKVSKTAQVSMENIATVNKKLLSVATSALEILAAEVGVGMDELVDNIGFSDLGVDSLMSLTVSGRIREELDIEIHSHDFLDHPTIGAFKTFLSKFEATTFTPGDSSESSATSVHGSTPDLLEDSSNVTTPLEESKDEQDDCDIGELIRTTIAEEMGVDTEEIADTVDLTTLGMDSLMSLTILGRLREQTDFPLPGDLFVSNPSIRDIKRTLKIGEPDKTAKKASEDRSKSVITSLPPQRSASSVLLQGSLKRATKLVWLIPDGGGSATSYVDIPDLAAHVAVLGLNSPYMKVPEEYKCGVIGMAEAFVTEMKRRQPDGPYILAGWSAGGVIAFEAVNQLTKRGDQVERLILIDSPCPDIIEPLPSSLHRWFASIGLLGDGDFTKLPPWLLPHFAASVNALSNYSAEQIDLQNCPHVTAIWCEDGVCKLPTDPRPDPFPYGHAQFLLDNRTDFGPNLWDKYLDPAKFVCKQMPGNHFSMMKKPHVNALGDILREAINTPI